MDDQIVRAKTYVRSHVVLFRDTVTLSLLIQWIKLRRSLFRVVRVSRRVMLTVLDTRGTYMSKNSVTRIRKADNGGRTKQRSARVT